MIKFVDMTPTLRAADPQASPACAFLNTETGRFCEHGGTGEHLFTSAARDWMLASSLLQEAWCELGLPPHHDATRDEMLAKIRDLRRAAGAVPVPELTSLLEVAREFGATNPTLDIGPDGLRLTIGPDDDAMRIGTAVMLVDVTAGRRFVGTHTAGLFKYDRRPCPRCAEMDGWGCERHQRVT